LYPHRLKTAVSISTFKGSVKPEMVFVETITGNAGEVFAETCIP